MDLFILKKIRRGNQRGFTLIELIIALAIASIVLTGFYRLFVAQVKNQVSQQVELQMLQGARAALLFMAQEIQVAGCNPLSITPVNSATPWTDANYPQILVANKANFQFTRDFTGGQHDKIDNDRDGVVDNPEEAAFPDGACADAGENVVYFLDNDPSGTGINSGLAAGAPCNLVRNSCPLGVCSGVQVVAPDIDALNFVYLDNTGAVIPTPIANNLLNTIRQVQITIVARSGQFKGGITGSSTDKTNYTNQQGTVILPAPKDKFRRIRLTTTVTCRNMSTGM